MMSDEENSFLQQDESSEYSFSEIPASQLAKRRRGRPKLSKLALPISGIELRQGTGRVCFPNLDEYELYIKGEEEKLEKHLKKMNTADQLFVLKESTHACDRLVKDLELNTDIVGIARQSLEDAKAYQKEKIMVNFCSASREVIRKRPTMSQLAEIPEIATNKLDCRIAAAYLRLNQGLKYKDIQRITGLSVSSCHSAVRQFMETPTDFIAKMKQRAEKDATFYDQTKERLSEMIGSGKLVISNKAELISELRRFVLPGKNLSDCAIYRAARIELQVKKRIPKKKKPICRDSHRMLGEMIVKKAIIKLFYIDNSLAIFDSTTFAANFKPNSVWTVKGILPYANFPGPSCYLHAHVLISRWSVESVVIQKGSTKTKSIRNFFISSIEKIKEDNFGILPFRYILLDNAPVHSRAMISELSNRFGLTFIFNMPNNPTVNPIEWLFGSVKAKFRRFILDKPNFTAQDIIEIMHQAIKKSYNATMDACLKAMLC